jgi:hypothetical protein
VSGLQHLRNNQALAANHGSPRRDLAIPFNHIEGIQVAVQTVAGVSVFEFAGVSFWGGRRRESKPSLVSTKPAGTQLAALDWGGGPKDRWTPRPTSRTDFLPGT